MAVRWKRYSINVGLASFFLIYVAVLQSTIGSMKMAQSMLSISIQQLQDVTAAMDHRHNETRPEFNAMTKPQTTTCNPLIYQPLQKVETFGTYANYKNLSQLSIISGDYESPLAICKLDMKSRHWMRHFPHVMQHLYACYTYWIENPSKIPVLYPVGVTKTALKLRHWNHNAFLKGFLEILESQLKVQTMQWTEIEDWLRNHNHTNAIIAPLLLDKDTVKNSSASNGDNSAVTMMVPVNPKVNEIQRPLGYVLSNAKRLNEMAQKHYEMAGTRTTAKSSTSQQYATKSDNIYSVRVGILNRNASKGRSIMNAEVIVQSISEVFGSDNNNFTLTPPMSPASSSLVPVEYFEGVNTLEEQIRFYNSIDILISPHGAQLTGVPFMANKACTQLIEFFPERYYMPDFFGSLAIDSGIGYRYVHFSPHVYGSVFYRTSVPGRLVDPSINLRSMHRAQNLCVDPAVAIDALQDAMRDWVECQQQQRTKT